MTDSSIALQKAVMIPVDDEGNPEFDDTIAVQFNPETLKVTQSNTLDTGNSGGEQTNAAQFVDKSESSLSVQLIFDTTIGRPEETITFDSGADTSEGASEGARSTESVTASHEANSDVRVLTKRIADAFMQPREEGDRLKAPKKCRFQWGTFAFVGMMSSYDETLDFFAPEGIPLRATLSLSFKEDRYQFENVPGSAGDRENPNFAPGGDDVPVADAAKNAKKNPKDWRNTALFNGIEGPRFSASAGLSIPGVSVSAGASLGGSLSATVGGFEAGLSGSLGTGLPGAFNASAGLPGISASASLPGLGSSASASLSGVEASFSADRFASASAMAAGGISSSGLSASASAELSGGISGGASAGFSPLSLDASASVSPFGAKASAGFSPPGIEASGQIDLPSPTRRIRHRHSLKAHAYADRDQ